MSVASEQTHDEWYREVRPNFEQLARTVESLLQSLLTRRNIDFLAVTSRAKTVKSFSEKLLRKTYKNPRAEITDLCGVRVITYLETDLERVAELIRKEFDVDDILSVDKSSALEVDRVGYRSVHFICKFTRQRSRLPEYADFSKMTFEIQARTALQHAWAQIEHDRNYKFSDVLPDPIQRRLYLAAGLLETADREFAAIAHDIDYYQKDVANKTAAGDLEIGIDSTSLLTYAQERLGKIKEYEFVVVSSPEPRGKLVRELRDFGIRSLRELDLLIDEELISATTSHYPPGEQTDVGFFRDAMMYSDPLKYFNEAWNRNWTIIDSEAKDFLVSKFGFDFVDQLLTENGVTCYDA